MADFPEFPVITLHTGPRETRQFTIPPLSGREIVRFVTKMGNTKSISASDMTEEAMTRIYEAVFVGVKKADPSIDFETFMSWPITFDEVLKAMFDMAPMAGVEIKKLSPEEVARRLGELQAGAGATLTPKTTDSTSPNSSAISTPSSPTS